MARVPTEYDESEEAESDDLDEYEELGEGADVDAEAETGSEPEESTEAEEVDEHEDPERPEGTRDVDTITDGYFEEEYYVSAEDAGAFLRELGEQFADDDEVTIQGDGWEIPFAFGEPVTLEIEYEGDETPKLEVEIEVSGAIEDEAPDFA
ncbi:MAG: amphi-Trp domain-containing protein [Halodesulfurarchaeum sp.]